MCPSLLSLLIRLEFYLLIILMFYSKPGGSKVKVYELYEEEMNLRVLKDTNSIY